MPYSRSPGGFEGVASFYRSARFCLWLRATSNGVKTAWSNTKQTSSTSPGTIAPTIRSANPAGTSTVQKAKYRRVPSGSAFHHRHMRLMLRGGASICATGVSRSLDPTALEVLLAGRPADHRVVDPREEAKAKRGEIAARGHR